MKIAFALMIALLPLTPARAEAPVAIDTLAKIAWGLTFAKPIAGGLRETLYFERDGSEPRMWTFNWDTRMASATTLAAVPLDEKRRYTAVKSTAGLWLIGPQVVLLRTDGHAESLPFDADEPSAVALHDGSVLVLGHGVHNNGLELRRLRTVAGAITITELGKNAGAAVGQVRGSYGPSMVTLSDGRVLLAGGGSENQQRAALIDPASGAVQAIPPMPHKRSFAASLALPDGRVVVAGHEGLHCQGPEARLVDLYDPHQHVWQSLPDLPFPLCADAYHATGPSGVVMPDGTIVLGGHLETHLLALRPAPAKTGGYAAFWEVVGPLKRQRISGTMQAISGSEIAIAGGLHVQDGCCYTTPGAEIVALPPQAQQQVSFDLPLVGTGAAQRGQNVFIAAGRRFESYGTGQMRYSSLAELLDLKTGQVKQLPTMPFVSGSAQLAWLDDDRVLVKGIKEASSNGFIVGSNLSSYLPPSSAAMAVFDLRNGSWGKVIANAELDGATLLGGNGDRAFFATPDAKLFQLNLSNLSLERMGAGALKQEGAVARRLSNGRTIVAAASMQDRLISLLDEQCEDLSDDPKGACPERYAGWGPMVETRQYQTLSSAATWTLNAAGPETRAQETPGKVLDTVIDAQGRVVHLIASADSDGKPLAVLDRSDAVGAKWTHWPGPLDGLAGNAKWQRETCPDGCRLLLAADPRSEGKELLFLREGRLEQDRYTQAKQLRIWWFDEDARLWHLVAQGDDDALRHVPLNLAAPLTGPKGRMQGLGWHLARPLVWMTK